MDTKQALRRMTNGSRVHRLTIGVLPDVLRRQLSTARRYRRELESLVLEAKGEVSLFDAHYIDEAAAAEVHAAVCRMLMRQKWDKMSVADVVICSKEILKSKGVRNHAIEKLGLDRTEANTIEALYSASTEAREPLTDADATDPQSALTDAPGASAGDAQHKPEGTQDDHT